jgi:hypothetical protein
MKRLPQRPIRSAPIGEFADWTRRAVRDPQAGHRVYRRPGSTATRLQSTLATSRHPSPTTSVRIKVRPTHEIFETQWLLDAIDEVDALRGHLSDDEHYRPPKICDDLLRLHQLAMKVVNPSSKAAGSKSPTVYRHLALLEVRFATWDLARVHLVDPHTGPVPCRLFPQDKGRHCHHGRRATSGPLAARIIDRQVATGLLPATCLSPRAHELKRLLGGRRSG